MEPSVSAENLRPSSTVPGSLTVMTARGAASSQRLHGQTPGCGDGCAVVKFHVTGVIALPPRSLGETVTVSARLRVTPPFAVRVAILAAASDANERATAALADLSA